MIQILTLVVALACAEIGHAEDLLAGPLDEQLVVLMKQFAESGIVRADFSETRRLTLLTDAIETRGVLYFAPPDRLARQTTHPGNARVAVHGGSVTVRDEAGTRSVDLSSSDVARSLLGNLMVLLRGDLAGLRERYTIAFRSDGPRWQMDLEPRAKSVRAIVAQIRYSGSGGAPETMETRETNGDITLTHFSNIETGLALPQKEFQSIFHLDVPDPEAVVKP